MSDMARQVDRYLDGDLGDDEVAEMFAWVAADAANADLFAKQAMLDQQARELIEDGLVPQFGSEAADAVVERRNLGGTLRGKSRWLLVLAPMLLVLIFASVFHFSRSADAASERDAYDRIEKALSAAFDFGEDDVSAGAEVERLTSLLELQHSFLRPRFPENTLAADRVEARLQACLALNYSRVGLFSLAQSSAKRAVVVSSHFRDEPLERSIKILAHYAMGKTRLEEARHEIGDKLAALDDGIRHLEEAVAMFAVGSGSQDTNGVLLEARVLAVLAVSKHKRDGPATALATWAHVERLLESVPTSERGVRWRRLRARGYADQGLSRVALGGKQRVAEDVDAAMAGYGKGIELLTQDQEHHAYLTGILYGNLADALSVLDDIDAGNRQEEQIAARTSALEHLSAFWNGSSTEQYEQHTANALDNIVLNFCRRSFAYFELGKREEAIRDVISIQSIANVGGRHKQLNGIELARVWYIASFDPIRSDSESKALRAAAIQEIQSVMDRTRQPAEVERVRSYARRALKPYLEVDDIRASFKSAGLLEELMIDE